MTTSPKTSSATLPEYENNPFISHLPELQSQRQLQDALAARPPYDANERNYSASLRKHCIMRLGRYFEPLERQIQLAERFGLLLRQGYVGRNPLKHDYISHLQNGVERIEAKSLNVATRLPVENTASSFALTGCSGIGKSKAIEKVLHQYPQCITHTQPFSLVQLTWLKLDCPYQGSPKQLCINFFSAVDRLIGTKYFNWYGSRRAGVDEMMVHMAHVANLHALGVLVIDEIQHLSKSKMGPTGLLNFLVTLVNTIGVPVILIGTLSAIPMLQENFRQARRANGLGSMVWDRMPKGNSWDYFITKLWSYQWTTDVTEINDEIRNVLYDESQGIIDIVVKLFMLAQLRIINIRELRHGPEEITADLLKKVAKEDFIIVQPMLNALRRNDHEALIQYDDLLPLKAHVETVFSKAIQSSAVDHGPVHSRDLVHHSPVDVITQADSTQQIRSVLRSLHIAEDVANVVITETKAVNPNADVLQLLAMITDRLKRGEVKPAKVRRTKPTTIDPPLKNDLRQIVAQGKLVDLPAYNSLLEAGIVRPPLLDWAA